MKFLMFIPLMLFLIFVSVVRIFDAYISNSYRVNDILSIVTIFLGIFNIYFCWGFYKQDKLQREKEYLKFFGMPFHTGRFVRDIRNWHLLQLMETLRLSSTQPASLEMMKALELVARWAIPQNYEVQRLFRDIIDNVFHLNKPEVAKRLYEYAQTIKVRYDHIHIELGFGYEPQNSVLNLES